MWKEIFQILFGDMSPVTRNKWASGLTFTWRSIALAFFVYMYYYTQDRKQVEQDFRTKTNEILYNQQWEKYQIQAIMEYRTVDVLEHSKLRTDLGLAQEDIALVKGYLGMKVKGIQ